MRCERHGNAFKGIAVRGDTSGNDVVTCSSHAKGIVRPNTGEAPFDVSIILPPPPPPLLPFSGALSNIDLEEFRAGLFQPAAQPEPCVWEPLDVEWESFRFELGVDTILVKPVRLMQPN